MSFYSGMTKAGLVPSRRLRREIKNQEAIERNARTPEARRRDYRRRAEMVA